MCCRMRTHACTEAKTHKPKHTNSHRLMCIDTPNQHDSVRSASHVYKSMCVLKNSIPLRINNHSVLICSERHTCSQSSRETDFLRRDALLHQSEKQKRTENRRIHLKMLKRQETNCFSNKNTLNTFPLQ